ncbi:auxin response factor 9-like [Dorcoceras hygrometricum]|uniref:Auxin response factor 9-like n=1 Tax=Dorcoceras hygrometricum TaxID=472368 RepID=A0A2Z7BXF2_9LAMI|nr:auxin response factor 9-like [Dorcoceras hygrometricum]
MASSLFVNTMQVNFESVLTMEHSGIAKCLNHWRFQGLRESFDSESNISLPITHLVRRNKTQRPQTQQRSIGERDDPQHGSIPAVPVEGSETRMDPVNPNESDGAQNESERSTVNSLEKETENTERAIIIGRGKGTLDVIAKLNPVEEHYQLVLKSAWNNMSAKMDIFDEWTHFHREVRLKDISSFDHLISIEEQLLEWGDREQISELFEQHSLIMYKLYGLEVEKLYNEHLANFKLNAPSVNHDYLYIRRLNEELKEIAMLHRPQLAVAGLPIMGPEAPFAGLVFNQPLILALAFSSQAKQEQAVDHTSIQPTVQYDSEAVKSQDHQVMRISHQFKKSSIRLWTMNTRLIVNTTLGMRNKNNRMQSMEFKLRSMNSHIERLLDTQTFLKLDFGRHKCILYEKVDTLASTVKSSQTALKTSLIRQLDGLQQQFIEDLDMVKFQLSELVEHLKQIGNDKKGGGGQSRPEEGLNRSGEEGSSNGQSSIRGRGLSTRGCIGGPSSRGGRGSSPGRSHRNYFELKPDTQRYGTNWRRRRVAKKGSTFNEAILSSYKHLKHRRKFNLDAFNVSTEKSAKEFIHFPSELPSLIFDPNSAVGPRSGRFCEDIPFMTILCAFKCKAAKEFGKIVDQIRQTIGDQPLKCYCRGVQSEYLAGTCAWLQPELQEPGSSREIAVDNRQSGPRPEPRLLRQAALEALKNSARTDSPRRIGRNEFRRLSRCTRTTEKFCTNGFSSSNRPETNFRRRSAAATAAHGWRRRRKRGEGAAACRA